MQALVCAIKKSKEGTWQSFNEEQTLCSQTLLASIKEGALEDRTIMPLRALAYIFSRMTQKVDYEKTIEEIKTQIVAKGLEFAQHCLHTHVLINKFSEPHLREGMVSSFDC